MLTPSVEITFDNDEATSGAFLFTGETHTMGNAIRQTIFNRNYIDFCGYSVPHPAETKMALRVQISQEAIRDGKIFDNEELVCDANIVDVVNKGLDDFSQWCCNTANAFDEAFESFQSQ